MDNVLAIIPARTGSRGIKNKNFRNIGTDTFPLCVRAAKVAQACGLDHVISTDADFGLTDPYGNGLWGRDLKWLRAPAPLHTDTCAMIDVVKDVLARVPGPLEQKVILLQPTQPLRTAAQVQHALECLTSDWDSVVTVTPIPRTHAPDFVRMYCNTTLSLTPYTRSWEEQRRDEHYPARRQDVPWPYIQDGTAYCFYRKTVESFGDIYGDYVRGIIIEPHDTCALDTEADWLDAERRLRDRTPSTGE